MNVESGWTKCLKHENRTAYQTHLLMLCIEAVSLYAHWVFAINGPFDMQGVNTLIQVLHLDIRLAAASSLSTQQNSVILQWFGYNLEHRHQFVFASITAPGSLM